MIQCALLGEIEPKDEQELNRIARKQDVKNKGMFIQMPPLHTSLVKVHQGLAKTIHAAKEMAKVCKCMTKARN